MKSLSAIKEELMALKDRGYILVGVHSEGDRMLDILMIHKNWTEFSFVKQMRQASNDLSDEINRKWNTTLEIPTRHMYENDRIPGRGPTHEILFDLRDKT